MKSKRMKATLLTTIIILSIFTVAIPVSAVIEPYYSTTIEVDDSGFYLALTVTDDGDWVTWTFDFPVEEFTGDGNLNVGLIIALDGDGEGPAFQIHNNDGATGLYPHGTWMYGSWGPAIDTPGTWFGWPSADLGVPVTTLDWVEASGARKGQGTDGILQIKIKKAELGNAFHWAASPTVGSGFFAPAYDVTMQVPTDFGWSTPIVDMEVPNYKVYPRPVENLNTESTYWTIQSAIDEANTGDTIEAAAGIYDEDVSLPNDKDGLVLLGANAGVPAGTNPAVRYPESVIIGQILIGSGTTGAGSITVDGFTITSGGQTGIYVRGRDTITISNNIIDCEAPHSGSQVQGIGMACNGNPKFVITDNTISNGRQGILIQGANTQSSLVSGNDISHFLVGITPSQGDITAGQTIIGNRISDASLEAISINHDGNVLQGNILTESAAGLRFYGNAGPNNVVDSNGFVGNDIQVESLSANVDIGSILADNTFDRAVVIDRSGDSLLPMIHSYIQEAVDEAESEDTVLVYPGTYEEAVNIDVEGLTLESTELHEAIIGAVTIKAEGVTLEGFDIQGGVSVWEYGDVTVAYNKVTSSTSNGIVYGHGNPSSGNPGTVTHNIVNTPGKLGIYLDHDYIYDFTVTYNTLQDCRKSIGFGSLSGGIIEHNDISGSTQMDVEIFDATTATVNHNNLAGIVCNVDPINTLDAENNWWGTGVESEVKALAQGLVDYDPWFGGESVSEETGSGDDTVNATDEADTIVVKSGTGTPTISVAEFAENPGEGFSNDAGKYYDVKIDDDEGVDSLTLRFYYKDSDLGGREESTLSILWHDGTSWVPCSHQTLYTVSDISGYSGYIEVYVAATGTTPLLSEMTGTPFGVEGELPEVSDERCDLSVSGDVIVEAAEDATIVYASMGDTAEITVEMDLAGYHGDIHFTLYKKVDGGLAYVDEIRTVYGVELKGSRTADWVVDQNPGNYVVWINIDLIEKVQLTGLDEALHIGPIEVIII